MICEIVCEKKFRQLQVVLGTLSQSYSEKLIQEMRKLKGDLNRRNLRRVHRNQQSCQMKSLDCLKRLFEVKLCA